MKKLLGIIKNKWLIKGTTTLILVEIIIAIYILLNWGVEKINLEDFDLTDYRNNEEVNELYQDRLKEYHAEAGI